MVKILVISLLFCPFVSMASVFYDSPSHGWYWYDENIQSDDNDINSTQPLNAEAAKQQIEAFKQEIENKKAIALTEPTEHNIKEYIKIQNEANNRAAHFASVWQKVVIQNPELDNSITNPTNAVARKVYYQEQANQEKHSIKAFTEKYGLFFFFKSDCPYCHKFAPILKMFEEEYGVTVIPVSLDGQGLPEYPYPKPDNGIATKLKIEIVPAVIAVAPKTGEIVPVSYGLVSVEELAHRINLIADDLQGAVK